ncbi:MAG: hypothetical protein NT157_04755 [Candidatus Micrarchaeota archaeon]|nr:hypothetical protein [Candidatus Micrarchaeota archaeon]
MSAARRKAPQAQPQPGEPAVFRDSVLEADPILSKAASERALSEVKITRQAREETEMSVARLKAKFDKAKGKAQKGRPAKGQANEENEKPKEGKKINFSFFGFKK